MNSRMQHIPPLAKTANEQLFISRTIKRTKRAWLLRRTSGNDIILRDNIGTANCVVLMDRLNCHSQPTQRDASDLEPAYGKSTIMDRPLYSPHNDTSHDSSLAWRPHFSESNSPSPSLVFCFSMRINQSVVSADNSL